MCKQRYTLLARRDNASVQWCHGCETYIVTFNNLVFNFTKNSFEHFKSSLQDCYEDSSNPCCRRDARAIYFQTRLSGMQLLFSLNEVGELLLLMQQAEFSHFASKV